ncbi:MAG: DUF503 domain-containing protein [Phycisphaerales bacterium]|nr:MAG: DUF503 domain-containing protein [Phycisphaerales bacterium]
MFIGVLQFELVVPGSRSLKDKRRVVKSVKDRLHREHMVSVAEVEALEHHRLAVMGLACVSNSTTHINSVLDRITEKLRSLRDARLGDVAREVLHGDHLPHAAETPGEAPEPLWTEDERRAEPQDPTA